MFLAAVAVAAGYNGFNRAEERFFKSPKLKKQGQTAHLSEIDKLRWLLGTLFISFFVIHIFALLAYTQVIIGYLALKCKLYVIYKVENPYLRFIFFVEPLRTSIVCK